MRQYEKRDVLAGKDTIDGKNTIKGKDRIERKDTTESKDTIEGEETIEWTIRTQILELPLDWYHKRIDKLAARVLVEHIISLLSTRNLVAKPQDERMSLNLALLLYQLLAQLLNHNWKNFCALLEQERSSNPQLKNNLSILSEFTSQEGVQVSEFTKNLCQRLSKWIIERM